ALVDAGHEVHSATDGQEALAAIARIDCEVVVTDWHMPNLDGIGLCHAIRRGASAGYVYVILLTSHNSVAERIQGLSAGADDFMSKPFEPQELLARLQAAERIVSLETRDVAIFSLAKLAESRDPETGAHLERVQSYCRALAHHEHFDGTGYPNGCGGNDIPLCGRIVALADVYDALTSKRVYKDAFAHDVARDIIEKESGSHFDPAIVKAFIAAEPAFAGV